MYNTQLPPPKVTTAGEMTQQLILDALPQHPSLVPSTHIQQLITNSSNKKQQVKCKLRDMLTNFHFIRNFFQVPIQTKEIRNM